MITVKKGNLLDCTQQWLAHGVNARGGFGSGIAGAIKQRWPYAAQAYFDQFTSHGLSTGDIFSVNVDNDRTLWHMVTQDRFGYDGGKYASIEAIEQCLTKLNEQAKLYSVHEVAIPKIGCGLGGLDWCDVEQAIIRTVTNFDAIIYEL